MLVSRCVCALRISLFLFDMSNSHDFGIQRTFAALFVIFFLRNSYSCNAVKERQSEQKKKNTKKNSQLLDAHQHEQIIWKLGH